MLCLTLKPHFVINLVTVAKCLAQGKAVSRFVYMFLLRHVNIHITFTTVLAAEIEICGVHA